MNHNHTYRKPIYPILLLALWSMSIFGSSIITCCVGIIKNHEFATNKTLPISMDPSKHEVQWINADEVMVDGILYDAVSGNKNDQIIEVITDIPEQNAISYIAELNKDPYTSPITTSQKPQFKFLPDLFFETAKLVFNIYTPQNKYYNYRDTQVNFGYYNRVFQPPQSYFL